MPDPTSTTTVLVNLIATGHAPPAPAWSVEYPDPDGGNVTVNAGSTDEIKWVLHTAPLGAAITRVQINPGEPGNHAWAGPEPSAPDWSTMDQNVLPLGSEEIDWDYEVEVTYRNIAYWLDPQIKNPPPTLSRRSKS